MKVNLTRFSVIFTFVCLVFATVISPSSWAGDAEIFITKLKKHHQHAPPLEVFALNYHYLGGSDPYQSWDYQSPDRYMALRMVEIDLVKKHFVENDIHHFPDGVTANRVQFQNDNESFFYDKNGLALGKGLIKQSMESFDEIKGHIFMNIDFLAIKPLLNEINVAASIKFFLNKVSNEVTLTHTVPEGSITEYVFNKSTMNLQSINNKSQNKVYIYDDYQTSNGITFARSILKYYDGATNPSFIHRIDQLHILEKIDPARLKVPKEFGPIIPKKDNRLISQNLAPNLFLVTDSSTVRNCLFKINGDDITVFGGAVSVKLAEQTINLIERQFPNKRISAIHVTHPHSDHIEGLTAYAKRGIVIRADEYTIAGIKDYPYFSTDVNTFKFQTIEHGQLLNGTRFYVLESTRAKRQSFVHFEDKGIIFQSDFLFVASDNTIAKVVPNFTKTFIDFIRNNKLKFTRIIGHHRNNNISVAVMNKIYNAIR